jgi:1,4-dihydroxy-2-naphthoate octaprenyltransferase
LNINNIRDIESDREAGKFSIPVRVGRKKAIWYHWFLLFAGITSSIAYTIINFKSGWQLIFFLSIPLFIRNAIAIKNKPSSELDPFLKQMALTTLLFVLLFGLGVVI